MNATQASSGLLMGSARCVKLPEIGILTRPPEPGGAEGEKIDG